MAICKSTTAPSALQPPLGQPLNFTTARYPKRNEWVTLLKNNEKDSVRAGARADETSEVIRKALK
jgi:hypothetical protein